MRRHFVNRAQSSFLLWLNHYLLQEGQAYYNYSGLYYPTNQRFNGLYTYSIPFSQLVSDSSVSGAHVPTGIYVNGNFIVTGQSGFFGYDYERGYALFQNPITGTVSGVYSIKDFNVALTSEPEERIIFEKQLTVRPKYNQSPTGLKNNEVTYPIIFVKNNYLKNTPFSLGGVVSTRIEPTCYVFADSQEKSDAVAGLLVDSVYSNIAFFQDSDMPYDTYGRFNSGIMFNYYNTISGKTPSTNNSLYISEVNMANFEDRVSEKIKSQNPNVYFSMIDFKIDAVRMT